MMYGWLIVLTIIIVLTAVAIYFLFTSKPATQNKGAYYQDLHLPNNGIPNNFVNAITLNHGLIEGADKSIKIMEPNVGQHVNNLPVGLTNPNSVNVNNDSDQSLSLQDKRLMAGGPQYIDNANYVKDLHKNRVIYKAPIFGGAEPVRFPGIEDINNIGGTYPVWGTITNNPDNFWKIVLQTRYTMEQLIADLSSRTYQDYGEYQIGINGQMIGGIIHGSFYPVRNMPKFPTGIYVLDTSIGVSSKPFELIDVDFSVYK